MKKNYSFSISSVTTPLYPATFKYDETTFQGYTFGKVDGTMIFLTDEDPGWFYEVTPKLAKYILGDLYKEEKRVFMITVRSSSRGNLTMGETPVHEIVCGFNLDNIAGRDGRVVRIYNGQNSYHYTDRHVMNVFTGASDKDTGGIELETEFGTSGSQAAFGALFRSNYIFMETDGSLSNGIEFITIPLPREFFSNPKFWEPLCKMLADCGAKSHDGGRCGLHEHVNEAALDDVGLVNLYELEHTLEQAEEVTNVLTKIYRRAGGSYCRDIPGSCLNTIAQAKAINAMVPNAVSKRAMTEIRKKTKDSLSADHCYKLNVRTSTGETFEFRQGRGSLVPKSIAKIAEINELKVRAAAKGITSVKEFAVFCSKRSKLSNQLFEGINEI